MRLVHVVTVPDSLIFLEGQCAYMVRRGIEVTVVTSPGDTVSAFGREEGVAVEQISMRRAISPLADLSSLVRMVRMMWRVKPDVVHTHTPKAGLLGMMSARLVGVPVRIHHIHGLPFDTASGWKRHLLRSTDRLTCGLSTQVLCVSASIMVVAISAKVVRRRDVKVLLSGSINGIDGIERFNPERQHEAGVRLRRTLKVGPEQSIVGFVGRLVKDKGVEELASAWGVLRERHQDVHLMLVGKLEPEDPISATALRSLQDDPRVHFLGFMESPETAYAAMSVLVLPSHREGFGLAALEAGAMEVPVVASAIPGLFDAVADGETGTLVPKSDPFALCEAIDLYLSDADLRSRHAQAGRRRALQDFQQQDMWESVLTNYVQLMARVGGRERPTECAK